MMNYFLANACQNTFVLFDCMDKSTLNADLIKEAHQCLVHEQRDDALILYNKTIQNGEMCVQMCVLGMDGLFGEFCGNGARASAAFLYKQNPDVSHISIVTVHGKHPLKNCGKGIYSVHLPPARFEINKKFISKPEIFEERADLVYVEMLEPHLLVRSALSDAELHSLGTSLNQQKDVFPLGINVNAWQIVGQNMLFVKTYERGVQRLTLSCGTGSASCASYFQNQGKVDIQTPGGFLTIAINDHSIELKGPAELERGAA